MSLERTLASQFALRSCALLFFVGFSAPLRAQEPQEPQSFEPLPTELPVLDPSPLIMPTEAPASREGAPNPPADEFLHQDDPLAPVLGESLSREEQVRSKKWRIVAFARFGMTADDNVFIQHTNPQSDFYFTVTPGIAAGWGAYEKEIKQLGDYFQLPDFEFREEQQNFAFAKYAANLSVFTKLHDEDSLDHDALIAGRWQFTKLTLGLRVRFQTLSGPDADVGNRVKRDILTASFTSSYSLSEKTSLQLNASNATYDYENQQDYTDTVIEGWLDYQWLPKTRVSIGTRLGTLALASSGDQTYEQLLLRLNYHATEKLSLLVDGGEELRQEESGGSATLNSVFNFGASYTPFDATTIYASAYRRNIGAVSAADQTITATGIGVQVRQRFFQRFYLGLEAGYVNSEYRSSLTGTTTGRTDDIFYSKSSISFDVTKYLSAQSAYQYRRNESSLDDFSFVENIVTVQLTFQF